MEWIRQWWLQPDHFRWLSGYLDHRNLRWFTRRMMAGIVLALGIVPVLMLFSPSGPHGDVSRGISVGVAICCAVMAALWLTRWPTRAQSVLFAVVSCLCIAASCLVNSYYQAGLVGCTAFAALAGYVAFFHRSHELMIVLAAAAATSAICAGQLAGTGDVAGAIGMLIVIAIGVLAVPFSAQVLVHLLGGDASKSDTDPLTGLRNRRGFYRSALSLAGAPAGESARCFTVAMVDLDRFKQINDTRGHATGDRILVAVADELQRATGEHGVVARVGGEEFLVAESTPFDMSWSNAERLRAEIAAIPLGVTASVGVASVVSAAVDDNAARRIIEQLVHDADTAMYVAKRAGGNQTRHFASTAVREPADDEAEQAQS